MDNSPSKTPILENLGKMFSKLLSHEELSDIENWIRDKAWVEGDYQAHADVRFVSYESLQTRVDY
jgi:hypothetical protein